MPPTLHHECTRVPVTALASCGALLIAAEGPFLRFYHAKNSQYISSKRIFKAQAVHGICVYSEELDHVTKLVVWGGRYVCAMILNFDTSNDEDNLGIHLSNIAKAPDWILDLAPRPESLDDDTYQRGTCVAVTAHNALLKVTIERHGADGASEYNYPSSGTIAVSISELTSSSRSILYSAHLFWESLNRVLVAAGTAFGEIIYWSWCDGQQPDSTRIHRVFLGHEGSVFGVQISKELPYECCQHLRRVVASCSDDRTIRIWDVSDVDTDSTTSEAQTQDLEVLRTRHTGFSNEAFDSKQFNSSDCLAIGWGHLSRIWTVRFLEASPCSGSLMLQSAGEDATARTWEMLPNSGDNNSFSYKLLERDCAAYHSGKNMWSTAVSYRSRGPQQVICGGADSKITAAPLLRIAQTERNSGSNITEYTVNDVLSRAQHAVTEPSTALSHSHHRSSKNAEFFRSYCFLDEATFLLTTNSGKVLRGALSSNAHLGQSNVLSRSTLIGQPGDLSGYSVCTSGILPGIAFIAGASGSIYMYHEDSTTLEKIHSVSGKVGDMLAVDMSSSSHPGTVALFCALVGQKKAQLLHVDITKDPKVCRVLHVPISESLTGSLATSMAYANASEVDFLILGFRRGSIAVYVIREDEITLFRVIGKAHDDETVTSLTWVALATNSPEGHLLAVGRDGRLSIHYIDLSANLVELVHNLPLPFGPNLEGLYLQDDRILVHGFSSKKWFLYDVTAEEEVMSIDTGGAHRSWAFHPHSTSMGGTLVWTRASGMHIYSQIGANHTVIRPGGHGREIKAIAVSPNTDRELDFRLIATGAEDTDIKIFRYIDSTLTPQRTLRKHTTGIQHLQWSANGDYLFSSGGCEEFYIWRVRNLPSPLDFGIMCEHVYAPESEHSDLRIMSFDVTTQGSVHVIAMVFSDSSMKVYRYDPTAAVRWQPLAQGLYFTSCLTQCHFLSLERVLTVGTDGHAVVWPLPTELNRPSPQISGTTITLNWQHPARIHQNSSKVMVSHTVDEATKLIVSGGDDGSLAFLLARCASSHPSTSPATSYAFPPILVNRAHGSAVTACTVILHGSHMFLLTSGNDEWVRLWGITLHDAPVSDATEPEEWLRIQRLHKVKTNVADVSSMSVLDAGDAAARVVICGVGMEVLRIEWDAGKLLC